MNHKIVANKIVNQLPTDVSNVSVSYLNKLIDKYAKRSKDFLEVKRLINEKKQGEFENGKYKSKNSIRRYNQYLR